MDGVKGVYKIINILNGKSYIGSASSNGGFIIINKNYSIGFIFVKSYLD